MAYRNVSDAIQRNNRPTGGQGALRRMTRGDIGGRNEMSRYTGPDAQPAGALRQGGGVDNIRSMLTQRPNEQAFQHANQNAAFLRQPPGPQQPVARPMPPPPGVPQPPVARPMPPPPGVPQPPSHRQ
jgi:hypothetical protein